MFIYSTERNGLSVHISASTSPFIVLI